MRMKAPLLVVVLLGLTQGCNGETVKRTTFETLQNVQQQRCLKAQEPGCPERESYDSYQQQRKVQQQGE